jgi:hypothetical protein
MRADLTCPIHLRETSRGLVVMDGVHRLLKATLEGRDSLPSRLVPNSMLEHIYVKSAARHT